MLCSNAETLDFWNKRRLRNVFHIQCNASEPAAPDSSTRLANSVIQMRWHIWDPSNATVWGLKIQGWNSMAQQLCRMVEGALTHRVGLLVAVSYYGSAVLGRLSSAARPGAVRARLPLRYLPCSSARSRIWSRALAHTVSTAPLAAGLPQRFHGHLSSGSLCTAGIRTGQVGEPPRELLFPSTASVWAFLKAPQQCCTNAPVWSSPQPGRAPAPFLCLWKFLSPAPVPKAKLSDDRSRYSAPSPCSRGAFQGWCQQLHVQTAPSKLTPYF